MSFPIVMSVRLCISLCLGFSVFGVINAVEEAACGGKPADVEFLLDSSASIEFPDFYKQVKFTQDVVSLFDIGPGRTRVGVALFSDSVHPIIDLTRYTDKQSLISAIAKLHHIAAGTNTAEALNYVVEKVYNNDVREGVPKITIVLTDGRSRNKTMTMKEANRMHAAGISTFVIGIGPSTDEVELKAIASDPDSEFLLQIENFSALERIKQILAIKTCEVQYVEPQQQQQLIETTVPYEEPQQQLVDNTPVWLLEQQQALMDEPAPGECSLKVVFGADTSGMTTGSNLKISAFFNDVVESVPSVISELRSSQIMNDCPIKTGSTGNKSYSPLIRKMRLQVTNGRVPAKYIGVILIDTIIADFASTMREVLRSKFKGFKLLVVAVDSADVAQVAKLFTTTVGSLTFKEHVFAASSTRNLHNFVSEVSGALTKRCFQ